MNLSFHLYNDIREQERRRVRVLSARGLVFFCFPLCLRAQVICYLVENDQFHLLYVVIVFASFQGKSPCYYHNNAVYG